MGKRKSSAVTRKAPEAEARELLRKLAEVKSAIAAARGEFDRALEPEVVEACIYELNALRSRYAFLLRRARELDAEAGEGFCFPRPQRGRAG